MKWEYLDRMIVFQELGMPGQRAGLFDQRGRRRGLETGEWRAADRSQQGRSRVRHDWYAPRVQASRGRSSTVRRLCRICMDGR
jgi:hypothetical protein